MLHVKHNKKKINKYYGKYEKENEKNFGYPK